MFSSCYGGDSLFDRHPPHFSPALYNNAIDVVELLANIPKPPETIEQLKLSIRTIGGEITRFNPDADTISIKLNGKKNAKRFRITKLLEDIRRAVIRLLRGLELENHPTQEL